MFSSMPKNRLNKKLWPQNLIRNNGEFVVHCLQIFCKEIKCKKGAERTLNHVKIGEMLTWAVVHEWILSFRLKDKRLFAWASQTLTTSPEALPVCTLMPVRPFTGLVVIPRLVDIENQYIRCSNYKLNYARRQINGQSRTSSSALTRLLNSANLCFDGTKMSKRDSIYL